MFTLISKFLTERSDRNTYADMQPLLRQFIRRVSYVQGQSLSPRTREYFYYIDHQGQLFLDDTKVKNFITCFKDKKFLEFFFKRVKVNTSSRYESDFPYVSPCGRETNYIHCDDLPIVFSHLLAPDGTVVQDIASYGNSSSQQCSTDGTPLDGTPLDETQLDGAPLEYGTVSCKGSERATGNDRTSSKTTNTATSSTEPMHPSSVDTNVSKAVSATTDVVTRDRTGSPLPVAVASLAYGGTHSLRIPFQPRSLCMLPASGRVYHAGPERLGGVGLVKSSLAIELSRFFVYEEGAGESAHPVGFRWRGRTWELDTSVLGRLAQLTSIRE